MILFLFVLSHHISISMVNTGNVFITDVYSKQNAKTDINIQWQV
jgi:hypothetical protein